MRAARGLDRRIGGGIPYLQMRCGRQAEGDGCCIVLRRRRNTLPAGRSTSQLVAVAGNKMKCCQTGRGTKERPREEAKTKGQKKKAERKRKVGQRSQRARATQSWIRIPRCIPADLLADGDQGSPIGPESYQVPPHHTRVRIRISRCIALPRPVSSAIAHW